jgi:hypothetical protein
LAPTPTVLSNEEYFENNGTLYSKINIAGLVMECTGCKKTRNIWPENCQIFQKDEINKVIYKK